MAREWFVKEKKQVEIELELRKEGSEAALVLKWQDVPQADSPYKTGSSAKLPSGWIVSLVPSTVPPVMILSPSLNKSLSIFEYKEKINDSNV
jgi:hypothetical protein